MIKIDRREPPKGPILVISNPNRGIFLSPLSRRMLSHPMLVAVDNLALPPQLKK
jgi:hypothetical protein